MKISEFSTKFNISIDTIRHYMEMDIILPLKDGTQYDFDDHCMEDMTTALELKSYNFTIKEIQSYLYYDRLSQMGSNTKERLFHRLLKQKKEKLDTEMNQIQNSVNAINAKIEQKEISTLQSDLVLGVPLDALNLFSCPHCDASLSLTSNNIHENMILSGSLNCHCGWHIDIENGILVDKDYIDVSYGITLEEWSDYITEYVEMTSPDYFKILYTGTIWTKKNIDFSSMKTILDIRSGKGLFLRSLINDLSDNTIYISLDQDYRLSQFIKSVLEAEGIKKNIIFISTNHHHVPLKKRSVDCLIDSRGTLNYMIDPEQKDKTFYLTYFHDLMAKDASLFANYLVFDHFCIEHNHISEDKRSCFKLDYYKNNLKQLGIEVINTIKSNDLPYGSVFESFYHNNDRLHFISVIGKKQSEQIIIY